MVIRIRSIKEAWNGGLNLVGIQDVYLSGRGFTVSLTFAALKGEYWIRACQKRDEVYSKSVLPCDALQAFKEAADVMGLSDKVTLLKDCLILNGKLDTGSKTEIHLAYDSSLDRILED